MGTYGRRNRYKPSVTSPVRILEERGWKIKVVMVGTRRQYQAEKNGVKVTRPCVRSLINHCSVADLKNYKSTTPAIVKDL
jgi:hypothetical protein